MGEQLGTIDITRRGPQSAQDTQQLAEQKRKTTAKGTEADMGGEQRRAGDHLITISKIKQEEHQQHQRMTEETETRANQRKHQEEDRRQTGTTDTSKCKAAQPGNRKRTQNCGKGMWCGGGDANTS